MLCDKSFCQPLAAEDEDMEDRRKVITMCDVDGKTWVVCGKECCVIDLDGKSSRFKIPSSIAPLAISILRLSTW